VSDVVHIARCPVHGLHGERSECFVCGGPVEQVAVMPVGVSRRHLRRHRRNARRLGFAFWANVILAVLWALMVPLTLETGLKASVPFLAVISLYALMIGHTTGALAALAGKASSEGAAAVHAHDEPPGP